MISIGIRIASTIIAMAAAALFAAPAPARAGLLGAEAVSRYYAYGSATTGFGSPNTFVVDGAAHAPFAGLFDVTVTDTQVIYAFRAAGSWSASGASLNRDGLYIESGNLLSFAGAPGFASVTLNAATNMAGFSASNLTFDADEIAVTWAGRSFNASTRIVLDVAFAPAGGVGVGSPPAVPTPSSAVMMASGAGLMVLGLGRGRFRR